MQSSVSPRFHRGSRIIIVVMLAVGVLASAALVLELVRVRLAIDNLQAVVAALTVIVGTIIAAYSSRYMRSDPGRARFALLFACALGAVVLFVLADDAIMFGMGWLASGALLAILIGHGPDSGEARLARRRALGTFLVGDAAVLAGIGLLCVQANSIAFDDIIRTAATMLPVPVTIAALLLLVGASARCALPPFSGWLLSSMTAPTPVSALMHAGLVNAGGFLLLRFAPVLEAATAARYAAVALGLIAAIWGVAIMVVRPDIKRSLAGSTVSQMGFMIMSCGLGAYAAALWHLVAHGLFKAWLFLNAGSMIGANEARASGHRPASVLVGSGLALAFGMVLALEGPLAADLIPVLLATATGIATVSTLLASRIGTFSKLSLVAAIAVLVALHAYGMAAAGALVFGAGQPLLAPWASLVLLASFLSCWLWQTRFIAARRSLPGAIYVRLLNAGNLRVAPVGDRP